jgi:hypothetical protein
MDAAAAVPAQDDRFIAHAGDEEVARFGNLAFMPNEQPGASEQFLQFLAVNIGRREDFAVNGSGGEVDHGHHSAAARNGARSRPSNESQDSPFSIARRPGNNCAASGR